MTQQNINNPEYFLNREWSWLEFNLRVLNEAIKKNTPLLERIKFLSIVSSNLEEFFMVRVAGLKKLDEHGMLGNSADGLTPAIQLNGIRKRVMNMLKLQYSVFYEKIIPKLKEKGIVILTSEDKLEQYSTQLSSVFHNDIYPVITPLSVSSTHPFPNLVSGRLYLAVELESLEHHDSKIEAGNMSFIEIPTNSYGRFIKVDKETYVPLENIIKLFVHEIFSDYKIISVSVIKITRDADFVIEDDAVGDLLKEIESKIKRFHIRSVVKLEYEKNISLKMLKKIKEHNQISESDLYFIEGMLNLNDLMEIYGKSKRDDLKYQLLKPIQLKDFKGTDIFDFFKKEDYILFHPYHSYEPVTELINKAADDPDVLAIKQLLYRASAKSSIIAALVRAAEKGKQVSVVVELKARFDEKRNIKWAKRLEDAGAHVIYGVSGLKIHAKALLIIRREKNEIVRYVHLGTGNYNEMTARLYTDMSYFTCNEQICVDISSLFNLLTGFSLPLQWNLVSIAPTDLRNKFIALIKREIEFAKKGLSAKINAKMNSLSDKGIVEALYEASMAGVKINLIVRGICVARPKIKNISDNITIKSIVGKYLEHARLYYFHNGGNPEYYCSSADCMTRNLDRRIELLFPVMQQDCKDFIDKIFKLQLKDTQNSWLLNNDGSYKLLKGINKKDSFDATYNLIANKEKVSETAANKLFMALRKQKEQS